jgi:hypothetical protein
VKRCCQSHDPTCSLSACEVSIKSVPITTFEFFILMLSSSRCWQQYLHSLYKRAGIRTAAPSREQLRETCWDVACFSFGTTTTGILIGTRERSVFLLFFFPNSNIFFYPIPMHTSDIVVLMLYMFKSMVDEAYHL